MRTLCEILLSFCSANDFSWPPAGGLGKQVLLVGNCINQSVRETLTKAQRTKVTAFKVTSKFSFRISIKLQF